LSGKVIHGPAKKDLVAFPTNLEDTVLTIGGQKELKHD
jgi:Rieske Fe-S protein